MNQDTILDEKTTIRHDETNKIMDGVIELKVNIYLDLTVKFPFKYFRGSRYIMVMYDYNINSIIT